MNPLIDLQVYINIQLTGEIIQAAFPSAYGLQRRERERERERERGREKERENVFVYTASNLQAFYPFKDAKECSFCILE